VRHRAPRAARRISSTVRKSGHRADTGHRISARVCECPLCDNPRARARPAASTRAARSTPGRGRITLNVLNVSGSMHVEQR
jgi:hypothetical protein